MREIFRSLLHYVRAAAEELGRRRVFHVVIRAEETAPVRLYRVQRGRRRAITYQRGPRLERDVLRGRLHLDPRRLQRTEHRPEYGAV